MKTMREARNSKGFTQIQLSEIIDYTQVAISRIESGVVIANQTTKVKIEQALNERINWLDAEPILESMILSDWIKCEMLFRLLIQKINGLVEKNEREEFLETIIKYLRKLKHHNVNEKDNEKSETKIYF